MDSWSAPSGVHRLYFMDEISYFEIDRRSAYAPAPTFPTPIVSKACSVPTHDGIRMQCVQHRPPSVYISCEQNPEQAVESRRPRSLHRRPEHCELLAQCQVLEGQSSMRLEQRAQRSQHCQQLSQHANDASTNAKELQGFPTDGVFRRHSSLGGLFRNATIPDIGPDPVARLRPIADV